MGRPSIYSQEIADKICSIVANSSWGLKKICQLFPELPHSDTIRTWIVTNEEFSDQYARAKEQQADVMADEIIDIADQLAENEALTGEMIGAARLRVDSRKWTASKLKPKKYGDKLDVGHSGQVGVVHILELPDNGRS